MSADINTAAFKVSDVLLDDTMYVAFRKYLQDRRAAENLLFYKAAHNFKSAVKNGLKGAAAKKRAEEVYDQFLRASAEVQIYLTPKTLKKVEDIIFGDADPPASAFIAAAKEVDQMSLLSHFKEFVPTFKQSRDAPEFVQPKTPGSARTPDESTS